MYAKFDEVFDEVFSPKKPWVVNVTTLDLKHSICLGFKTEEEKDKAKKLIAGDKMVAYIPESILGTNRYLGWTLTSDNKIAHLFKFDENSVIVEIEKKQAFVANVNGKNHKAIADKALTAIICTD